jgi:hypothetical protein
MNHAAPLKCRSDASIFIVQRLLVTRKRDAIKSPLLEMSTWTRVDYHITETKSERPYPWADSVSPWP